jgi:hypothetical protein
VGTNGTASRGPSCVLLRTRFGSTSLS